MAKKGLGRGLAALIPDSVQLDIEDQVSKESIVFLPLDKIEPNPDQPRREFDPTKLSELAASIREHGVLQPIVVVKKDGGKYMIVAGERRWRASAQAELKEIPAIVRDLSELHLKELALIENIQREDLQPLEEAETYRELMELHGYTQEDLAARLGKSRPYIANTLRLLQLDDEQQGMLARGVFTPGHARALLQLKLPAQRAALAKRISEEGLSVRQTEEIARKLTAESLPAAKKPAKAKKKAPEAAVMSAVTKRLQKYYATPVSLKCGRGKGTLTFEFCDDEDLARLVELLLPGQEF
ncbi:MAG: ParB/RepB/Spo0J family partition protein [Firmicutes bacterium]|nr:ParB/RepB/Spo0J family partition protein [Bacillota bacterium]